MPTTSALRILKRGTRIETIGMFPGVSPERATIIRQDKSLPEYFAVKFEADGKKLCMHTSRFRVIDNR